MKYFFFFFAVCLLGCQPKPVVKAPKPPTPEIILGANPWRLTGQGAKLAISPSGTQLAVAEPHRFRVIDLQREVVLYEQKHSLGEIKQVVFLLQEKALLLIAAMGEQATLIPLTKDVENISLGPASFAETDRSGERLLFRLEEGSTCLIEKKDFKARRKIFWDCRSGFATFLPTGEAIRSRNNRLELSNKILSTNDIVVTGKIWADPIENRVYVLPADTIKDNKMLQEVDLTTLKVTLRPMPALNASYMQEPSRHSLLVWLPFFSFADANQYWLQFYDVSSTEILTFIDKPSEYKDVVVSPTGDYLYIASLQSIERYNLANQQASNTTTGHASEVTELLFADEDQLLIARDEKSVLIWDLATREIRFSIETSSTAMAIVGNILFISNREQELFAVRLLDGVELWRLPMRAPIQTLIPNTAGEVTVWRDAFAGRAVSVSPLTGQVREIRIPSDIETTTRGFQRNWKNSSGESIVWLADGDTVSITTPQQTQTVSQKIEAKRFQWLLNDRLIAAITNGRIVLVDAKDAKIVGLTGPQACQEELCQMEVSPKERLIAVTDQNTIHLWDVFQQKLLWEQPGYAAAFSSDGKWIAVSRGNGEIAIHPVIAE